MKTSVILVAGLFSASVAFGQNVKESVEVKAPQFKSELYNSLDKFLRNSIEYPYELKNSGIEGTAVVQFVVTQKGNVSDFTIVNSLGNKIDKYIVETLEITNGMWIPAKVDNQAVSMEKEISLVFSLRSNDEMIKTAKQYQQKGNKWMFVKNNPEKALKFYNRGINLIPDEESLLAARILCRYQTGDKDGANKDLNRLKILAERNGSNVNMEKFAELTESVE